MKLEALKNDIHTFVVEVIKVMQRSIEMGSFGLFRLNIRLFSVLKIISTTISSAALILEWNIKTAQLEFKNFKFR